MSTQNAVLVTTPTPRVHQDHPEIIPLGTIDKPMQEARERVPPTTTQETGDLVQRAEETKPIPMVLDPDPKVLNALHAHPWQTALLTHQDPTLCMTRTINPVKMLTLEHTMV
jgi:hypothetical protein